MEFQSIRRKKEIPSTKKRLIFRIKTFSTKTTSHSIFFTGMACLLVYHIKAVCFKDYYLTPSCLACARSIVPVSPEGNSTFQSFVFPPREKGMKIHLDKPKLNNY